MLSDLTSNPIADLTPGTGLGSSSSSTSAMMSKRKRGLVTPQSARSRRSSAASSSSNSSSSMASNRGSTPRGHASLGGGARRPPVPSSWTVRDYEDTEAGAGGETGDEGGDDFDVAMNDSSTNATVYFDGEGEGGGGQGEDAAGAAAGSVESDADGDGEGGAKRAAVVSPEAHGGISGETAGTGAGEGGETGAPKPRSRFARMKETNNIAVTAAAEAALRPKPMPVEEKEKEEGKEAGAGGKVGEEAAGKAGNNYMPSLEFQGPQYELSEAPSTSASSVPSASAWLQKVRWCPCSVLAPPVSSTSLCRVCCLCCRFFPRPTARRFFRIVFVGCNLCLFFLTVPDCPPPF